MAALSRSESSLKTRHTQLLLSPIRQLAPLVNSLSKGLKTLNIVGVIISAGLFVWAFFWMNWSLLPAFLTILPAALPTLVLLRIWWGLYSLKRLPALAKEAVENTMADHSSFGHAELSGTPSALHQNPRKTSRLLTQTRNLWEMRRLLGEVDDWLAHGLNIGASLNPLSLILGVISILLLGITAVIALILLLAAIF